MSAARYVDGAGHRVRNRRTVYRHGRRPRRQQRPLLDYFEQARLQHLQRLGIVGAAGPFDQPSRPFAIAETSCRYLSAMTYGETAIVRVTTTEVRNRSFTLAYEMVTKTDGRPVAEGKSAQVWLDEHGRPAPLPAAHSDSLLASCTPAE